MRWYSKNQVCEKIVFFLKKRLNKRLFVCLFKTTFSRFKHSLIGIFLLFIFKIFLFFKTSILCKTNKTKGDYYLQTFTVYTVRLTINYINKKTFIDWSVKKKIRYRMTLLINFKFIPSITVIHNNKQWTCLVTIRVTCK